MLIGAMYGHSTTPATVEQHPLVVGRGRVGVEIELENVRNSGNFARATRHWQVKDDGSLRNSGAEFVFNGPMGGVDLFNAVVEIDTYLSKNMPDSNWRCSTHVHLDVRTMTAEQLKLLILGHVVTEKFMFTLSGIHRYKNNFCSSIGFSQAQLEHLSNAWNNQDQHFVNSIIDGWDKYSALNFLPITRFGSVEFRLSEAKWRKSQLLKLCNRYLSLRELACGWSGTQEEFIEFLVNEDPHGIFDKGLPKNLYEGWQQDLALGYKLAHDILALSKLPVAGAPAPGERAPNQPMGTINVNSHPDLLMNFQMTSGSFLTLRDHCARAGFNFWGTPTPAGNGRFLFPFTAMREAIIHHPNSRQFLSSRRGEDVMRYNNWLSTLGEEATAEDSDPFGMAETATSNTTAPRTRTFRTQEGWNVPSWSFGSTGGATPVPPPPPAPEDAGLIVDELNINARERELERQIIRDESLSRLEQIRRDLEARDARAAAEAQQQINQAAAFERAIEQMRRVDAERAAQRVGATARPVTRAARLRESLLGQAVRFQGDGEESPE